MSKTGQGRPNEIMELMHEIIGIDTVQGVMQTKLKTIDEKLKVVSDESQSGASMENIMQLLTEIGKAVKKPQEEVGQSSPHSHTSSSTTFLPVPPEVEQDYQSVHSTAIKRSTEVLDDDDESESNLRSFIQSNVGYSSKKKAKVARGGRGHGVSKSWFVEEKHGRVSSPQADMTEMYKSLTAMRHRVLRRGEMILKASFIANKDQDNLLISKF